MIIEGFVESVLGPFTKYVGVRVLVQGNDHPRPQIHVEIPSGPVLTGSDHAGLSDHGGKPCIRGMRVTVAMIVGMIGSGHAVEQVLADYPYLEREDVPQALRNAAWRADDREAALSGS